MGELPVENAGKTGFSDHQVADAEIPVADDARAVAREVPAQAQEPELDGRMRLSDLVELCLEHIERSTERRIVRCAGEELQPRCVDGVNARELLRHLSRKSRTRGGELRLLHDAAPDRLTAQPFHGERFPPGEIREVAVRAGNHRSRLPGSLEHLR